MRLIPSFWRASGMVLAACLAVTFATYLLQGYNGGKWWSLGYTASLLIPITFAPLFVWFAFVPKLLEVTDDTISIGFYFRGSHTFSWQELTFWGSGQAVFMMRFDKRLTFQIFASAYPSDQWSRFIGFLFLRFPERKAHGWLAIWPFRWGP